MPDFKLQNRADIQKAYQENEREIWIRNFRVASILAFIFVPAGCTLDWVVYKDRGYFWEFLGYRLICSALLLFIWWFVTTPAGSRNYRILGLILPALPTIAISMMIWRTDGAASTYYAGLNLVLLGASIILRWTLLDSILVFGEVMFLFLLACLLRPNAAAEPGFSTNFFNNFYFLFVTGVFVVIGSHFYNRLRIREFAVRYELDLSKRQLETSNNKLSDQNIALERANREIKETEMQLVQSEKMSSLGRFSAGLLHDILNPLNYSRTGLFVLRKKVKHMVPEQRKETEDVIADIEDGLQRVESIIARLRTFTHPGGHEAEEVDLADPFNIALRFVASGLKEHNIAVKLNLVPGQRIWAGRNNLILVIVNLLSNSIDALAEKPFLDGESPQIDITSRREGDRSLLIIRDNGPGISPDNLPKIFDPFFTTKEIGKGTGLGLSICFGILRGYGGTISANSEPGRYCEFVVDLPATAEAAVKTIPENAEPIRL